MGVMIDHRHWLIDAINKANGTALRPNDVEFLGIWEKTMLPGGGSNTYNTSVRVREKVSGRESVFSYDRIANFFTDPITFYQYATRFTIKIPLIQKEGETLEKALANGFNRQYGIVMNEEDIASNSAILASDGLSISWQFSKKSFMYLPNTYTVQLTGTHVMVGGVACQIVTPARVQPDYFYEDAVDNRLLDMTKAINVAVATVGNDYSAIGNYLATFKNDSINWTALSTTQVITDIARGAELGNRLQSVDRLPWVCQTAAVGVTVPKINMHNALVFYNGRTDYFADKRWKDFAATPTYRLPSEQLRYLNPVDTRYTHVMVLCLNAAATAIDNKSATREFAIFHYNLEV